MAKIKLEANPLHAMGKTQLLKQSIAKLRAYAKALLTLHNDASYAEAALEGATTKSAIVSTILLEKAADVGSVGRGKVITGGLEVGALAGVPSRDAADIKEREAKKEAAKLNAAQKTGRRTAAQEEALQRVAAQKAAKEAASAVAAKRAVEEAAQEAAERSAEEAAKKTVRKAAQKAARETVREAAGAAAGGAEAGIGGINEELAAALKDQATASRREAEKIAKELESRIAGLEAGISAGGAGKGAAAAAKGAKGAKGDVAKVLAALFGMNPGEAKSQGDVAADLARRYRKAIDVVVPLGGGKIPTKARNIPGIKKMIAAMAGALEGLPTAPVEAAGAGTIATFGKQLEELERVISGTEKKAAKQVEAAAARRKRIAAEKAAVREAARRKRLGLRLNERIQAAKARKPGLTGGLEPSLAGRAKRAVTTKTGAKGLISLITSAGKGGLKNAGKGLDKLIGSKAGAALVLLFLLREMGSKGMKVGEQMEMLRAQSPRSGLAQRLEDLRNARHFSLQQSLAAGNPDPDLINRLSMMAAGPLTGSQRRFMDPSTELNNKFSIEELTAALFENQQGAFA